MGLRGCAVAHWHIDKQCARYDTLLFVPRRLRVTRLRVAVSFHNLVGCCGQQHTSTLTAAPPACAPSCAAGAWGGRRRRLWHKLAQRSACAAAWGAAPHTHVNASTAGGGLVGRGCLRGKAAAHSVLLPPPPLHSRPRAGIGSPPRAWISCLASPLAPRHAAGPWRSRGRARRRSRSSRPRCPPLVPPPPPLVPPGARSPLRRASTAARRTGSPASAPGCSCGARAAW